jgi:uncharacterized damage-inducible protein DinB
MNLYRIVTAIMVLVFAAAGSADEATAPSGFKTEMVTQMKSIQGKLVGLATETPEDKYGWRPAEGVRSTGEVFAHTAAANYFLLSMIGVETPEGLDFRSMEKQVTKKDDLIRALNDSYDFLYRSLEGLSDEELEKSIKLFGRDATVRAALLLTIEHSSEHLGQSIAYARMNGITPPWSRQGGE